MQPDGCSFLVSETPCLQQQGKLPFDGMLKMLAQRSSSSSISSLGNTEQQAAAHLEKMAVSLTALDEMGREGMQAVPDDEV